ncbi:hypothetical protein SEA_FEDE_27 [Microbacterium phage Fede]|nr:hypothetical protein SEA_FEDE_27 [Microbacterium phage Fede]
MADSRKQKIEQTLKTADNHRQLWSAQEDEAVLTRNTEAFTLVGHNMNDEELAIALGRTIVAVSQRRVVLKKLMSHGMTLEEIHEAERWQRAERNSIQYKTTTRLLAAQCPDCFCSPHSPNCPQEA